MALGAPTGPVGGLTLAFWVRAGLALGGPVLATLGAGVPGAVTCSFLCDMPLPRPVMPLSGRFRIPERMRVPVVALGFATFSGVAFGTELLALVAFGAADLGELVLGIARLYLLPIRPFLLRSGCFLVPPPPWIWFAPACLKPPWLLLRGDRGLLRTTSLFFPFFISLRDRGGFG